MKVFVDTIVIISAIVFSSGSMEKLIEFAFDQHQVVISEAVAYESRRVKTQLRSSRSEQMESLLTDIRLTILNSEELVASRPTTIRNESDQVILDDALASGVDFILTGDKDFHALELKHPRVMTPVQFEQEFLASES